MERVLVLGSSGAGKSTLARVLGQLLGVEVIHLDSHYWQPNWASLAPDAWDERLRALLARERWVMDGNYPRTLDLRLERADTIVFIDQSRHLCLWRCLGRYFKHHGGNRPELARGCNEKIDCKFLKWIWFYPRDVKPRLLAALAANADCKQVIVLRGDAEVVDFLRQVGQRQVDPADGSG